VRLNVTVAANFTTTLRFYCLTGLVF